MFKKIAIISLVALIPIIGQIVVLGWSLEITKRVMNSNPEVLPDLDFGGHLTRGVMAFIISFVYTLPITLFSGFTSIFSTVISNAVNDEVVFGVFSLITVLLSIFAVIYGLFVGLLLPAAFARYLAKDSIGAAFNFAEVFKMVQLNLGTYFIVLLGSIVAGLIAPMGLIACMIGVMLTYTYSLAVMGHFYGQAYLEATKATRVIDYPRVA